MKILYYPVQAGMMIPMCPTKECSGIIRIPITLLDVAKIRNGQRKSLIANFSCDCYEEDTKVIISK